MQGRLSPIINGKIQEFPWNHWREEFYVASELGFSIIEWTLDQDRLYESPLMTKAGHADIKRLSNKHGVSIPSLTGDCFMQAPFWKLYGKEKEARKKDLMSIIDVCSDLKICQIVIPIVDGGSIDTPAQQDSLLNFLNGKENVLRDRGVQIVFESDFAPVELNSFISQFSPNVFGINYDIGNSAGLGYDVKEEFAAYGDRILNVHVKDRVLNGFTVPLGEGNAEFDKIFSLLASIKYSGNYILQTARAQNGNHAGVLANYKAMVEKWILRCGS